MARLPEPVSPVPLSGFFDLLNYADYPDPHNLLSYPLHAQQWKSWPLFRDAKP